MGDSGLNILVILENDDLGSELKSLLVTNNIDYSLDYHSNKEISGLILLSNKINKEQKKLITELLRDQIPIIGIDKGFEGLNDLFGGKKLFSKKDVIPLNQLFLSPGSKLSHIIGGSGWVKSNFLQSKNIIQSQLSDFFFGSIISENGQILAFEKPGDHWVFGLNFDLINSELPKGFDNILEVFLHKCIE